MVNWMRSLGRRIGLVATPQNAAVRFAFDEAEIWDNDFISFRLNNDYVAFVRMDQTILSDIRIELRNAARVPVVRSSVFDIGTFRFSSDGEKIIGRDRNRELLFNQPIADISTFQFEDVPIDLSGLEPEPEPPPPPPVIDDWKVVYAGGMNIRSAPKISSTNKVGSVPGDWIFQNAGIKATADGFSWLQIYSGSYSGKDFAGQWIAAEQISPNVVFCRPAIEVSEPSSPTVQLAGTMRLEKRPDGYTRLTNVPHFGFNLRSAIHYADPAHQDLTLDWMKDNGFLWVRTYVAKSGLSMQDCIARTETFLNKCKARGIKVCLVITDSLRDSSHIIDDMIPFHKGPKGHVIYTWFTEKQYTGTYYQWVDAISAKFGSHEALGMIDLGNEFALYPVDGQHIDITQKMTDAYIDCFAEAARIAYTRTAGRVPVTCGWINANHFKPAGKDALQHARDAARIMKYLQVWGVHLYAEPVEINPAYHPDAKLVFEQDCWNFDYPAAKEFGKALVWGEFGSYESNWERALSIRNAVTRNPMVEIKWYWGVCPLVQGQNKDIVVNTGDCDGHALVRGRDGEGEFLDCVAAAKAA